MTFIQELIDTGEVNGFNQPIYRLPEEFASIKSSGVVSVGKMPKLDEIGQIDEERIINALQNNFSEKNTYDPIYTSGPTHGEGGGAFSGATLVPDGRVIFAPSNSGNVGIFDPFSSLRNGRSTALNPLI